jgi:putative heme degradation protein
VAFHNGNDSSTNPLKVKKPLSITRLWDQKGEAVFKVFLASKRDWKSFIPFIKHLSPRLKAYDSKKLFFLALRVVFLCT